MSAFTRWQHVTQRAAPLLQRVIMRLAQRRVRLGLLVIAAVALTLSLLLPYWSITLHAPQYPRGLTVQAYATRLTGDVREVDGLNHYIGMMELNDAARLERAVAPVAVPAIALLALASLWVPGRWVWLAIAPILLYPFVFLADLFAWLYHAGHSLDPTAALSSSIKPFTPRLLGEGTIGQFSTVATLGIGFYVALGAALLTLVVTLAQRWAATHAVEQAHAPHATVSSRPQRGIMAGQARHGAAH
jgi:copper chaperone NosL